MSAVTEQEIVNHVMGILSKDLPEPRIVIVGCGGAGCNIAGQVRERSGLRYETVAINSDESIRRLKGPKRPVIGQDERGEMLGSLECVDFVTIFDEDTPEPLLELLRPDVLAKGGTTPVVIGREIVEGYGGKVVTLDKVDGQSTTEIINRIVDVHDE